MTKVNNIELKDTKGFVTYIDNIPDLKWANGERFDDLEDIFREEYFSTTSFGEYSIRYFYYDKSYSLYFNDEKLFDNYKTIDEIKKKANEDYKNRLKMALNL